MKWYHYQSEIIINYIITETSFKCYYFDSYLELSIIFISTASITVLVLSFLIPSLLPLLTLRNSFSLVAILSSIAMDFLPMSLTYYSLSLDQQQHPWSWNIIQPKFGITIIIGSSSGTFICSNAVFKKKNWNIFLPSPKLHLDLSYLVYSNFSMAVPKRRKNLGRLFPVASIVSGSINSTPYSNSFFL